MISRCLLLLSVLLASSCSPDAPAPDATGIEGVVLEAGTERPLAEAEVSLQQITAITDGDGRFTIDNIHPGRYQVTVSKTGYSHEGVLSDQGIPFTLTAGEPLQNVVLKMVPLGSISGRIVNNSNEPIPDAQIEVFRRLYFLGQPQLSRVQPIEGFDGTARTDGSGEFRMESLEAGQYFERIVPADPFLAEVLSPGEAPPAIVLYPGVRELSRAIPVEVRAGQDTRLDEVRITPARLGRVRVRVINGTGEPGGFPEVTFKPAGWIGTEFPLLQRRMLNDIYEFQPDMPGTYEIAATWETEVGPRVGYVRVPFSGRDVEVDLTVNRPSTRLTGHVNIEDAAGTSRPLPGATLAFGPTPSFSATTRPDGSFSVPEVYGGRYDFGYLMGIPEDHYLARVYQPGMGDRDVLLNGLEVSGDTTQVELVVSAGAGKASGRVTNAAGQPVHNALVALVPEPPLRDRTDYYGAYLNVFTDQNGVFEFAGITPGAYQIYSWSKGDSGALRNTEYMRRFAGRGLSLQVEKGSSAAVDLKVID